MSPAYFIKHRIGESVLNCYEYIEIDIVIAIKLLKNSYLSIYKK